MKPKVRGEKPLTFSIIRLNLDTRTLFVCLKGLSFHSDIMNDVIDNHSDITGDFSFVVIYIRMWIIILTDCSLVKKTKYFMRNAVAKWL